MNTSMPCSKSLKRLCQKKTHFTVKIEFKLDSICSVIPKCNTDFIRMRENNKRVFKELSELNVDEDNL